MDRFFWGVLLPLLIIGIAAFGLSIGTMALDSMIYYEEEQRLCGYEPKYMSCERIEECYELCDEETFIQHSIECRTEYLPYLQECLRDDNNN